MKRSVRTLLTIALALIFLFSTVQYLQSRREKALGSSAYEEALAIAAAPNQAVSQHAPATEAPAGEPTWVVAPVEEDPHMEALKQMDLAALRDINPDVVGWILIPDTDINYPLMQGQDNDYYLNRTWDKQSNAMGSIFLEHLSSADLTDFNTIVYGHNMNDGSMFAGIREYRNREFWEAHPYVYILSDLGVYRYEIFAAYMANVKSNTYGISFPSETSRRSFLDKALQDSVIDTGLEPETTDRILTLSTCSGAGYSHRWVLQARLKMVLQ